MSSLIFGNNLNYRAPSSSRLLRVPNAAEQAALNLGIGLAGFEWVRSHHQIKKIKQDIFDPARNMGIARTRDADGDENMEKLNDGSAGKSTPGGTGADVQQTIIKNPTSATHGTIVFKKTFQIYTAGFLFTKGNLFSTAGILEANPFATGAVGITTPLCTINPDKCHWYMTRYQFDNLPNFSYASSCKMKVTPLGYRLPFATNEAASGYANSQTLVQIAYATGLNTMWNSINCGYTTATTNMSTPTGFTAPPDLSNLLYGANGSIGCSMGIPRHLNNYMTIISNNTFDVPLTDQINIVNVNDCKGCPIINYAHDFKNGLLKVPNPSSLANSWMQRRLMGPITGNTARPHIPKAPGESSITNDKGNAYGDVTAVTSNRDSVIDNSRNDIEQALSDYCNYQFQIEKAPYITNQLGQSQQPDRPPLINVGVLPVQSNAALSATPTFSDVVCQWMVQTELHVHYNMNYAQCSNIGWQYIKAFDPEVFGDDGLQQNTDTIALVSNRKPIVV
ncbi:putative VP1 protein [Tetranychus urticae-associated ambidensovirus]|uniref:Putative VP1 protein n=1 Tax=Tetranychus urticae-associated ambidensovirus TaxID=2555904 RepID=A0A482G2V7_9VIRU|nr:putative VP1 protein [Tetranychus urticae-associated ambidensovirus]QBO56619.1 putative VP1 protein [Tetranychus urticae-associated ambidensovirus]